MILYVPNGAVLRHSAKPCEHPRRFSSHEFWSCCEQRDVECFAIATDGKQGSFRFKWSTEGRDRDAYGNLQDGSPRHACRSADRPRGHRFEPRRPAALDEVAVEQAWD